MAHETRSVDKAMGEPSLKVALVTGGSRGLGSEICRCLARRGFAVIVNYRNSAGEAERLSRELGGGAVAVRADVSDAVQVRAMAEAAKKNFGRLDALVNNAGLAADNLLLRQSEEEWDRIIGANLTGCFNTIRVLAPLMARSGGGQIVNISSYSGLKGKAGQPAYSASKAALLGLTRTAAAELASHNIRVNAVLPGYMNTGMGSSSAQAAEKAARESLLKRLAEPAEAAVMIACLVESGYITGQVFCLDSRII